MVAEIRPQPSPFQPAFDISFRPRHPAAGNPSHGTRKVANFPPLLSSSAIENRTGGDGKGLVPAMSKVSN
jgi:hypothetical protein